MSISVNLNTQQLVVQYDNKKHNNVCINDMDVDKGKLYILIPPSLSFYQWNDFGESTV